MQATTSKTLINRKKLLAMIPLSERTIFNMEQRGEFPAPDRTHQPKRRLGLGRGRGMDRGAQVIGHPGHAAGLHSDGRSRHFLAAKTPRPSCVNDTRSHTSMLGRHR